MNKAEIFFARADTGFGKKRYPNEGNIKKIADMQYGGHNLQKYDLFYNHTDDRTKPVLVNVHGGGFVGGDKKNRDYLCNMFADNGWFVVNANYRLCPAVQVHDQISDIHSVLSTIPALKETHNIDDGKVVLTGDSAGAYLAGYMEAILTNKDLQQKLHLPPLDTKLSGLLLYSGAYNLPKLLFQKMPFNMAKSIGESITNIKSKNIDDIAGYKYFNELSLPQFVNDKWCPTMLSYATNDVFTKGQGETLHSVLSANGVPVCAHTTKMVFDNHNYHMSGSATAKEVLSKSLDFLNAIKNKCHKKSKFIGGRSHTDTKER
jgi:acetyl esterase/lipase